MTLAQRQLMAECEVIRLDMEEVKFGRLLEVCVAMNVLRKKGREYFKMNFEDKWYDVYDSAEVDFVDIMRYGKPIGRIKMREVLAKAEKNYLANVRRSGDAMRKKEAKNG